MSAGILFANTRKAMKGDSCIQVTIPKDLVDAFGIEGGDEILFSVQPGDETISVQPAEQLRPHE